MLPYSHDLLFLRQTPGVKYNSVTAWHGMAILLWITMRMS